MKTLFNCTTDIFPGVRTMSASMRGFWKGETDDPKTWRIVDWEALKKFAADFKHEAWAMDLEPGYGWACSVSYSTWDRVYEDVTMQNTIRRAFKKERPDVLVGHYNVPDVIPWAHVHKESCVRYRATGKIPTYDLVIKEPWFAKKMPEYEAAWNKHVAATDITFRLLETDFLAPCLYGISWEPERTEMFARGAVQLYKGRGVPVYPFLWSKNMDQSYNETTQDILIREAAKADGAVLWSDEKNPARHGLLLEQMRKA